MLSLLLPLVAVLLLAACAGGEGSGPAPDESEAPTSSTSRIPNVEGWRTDWGKATIDVSELVRGIAAADPRDRIPPLDNPAYVSPDEASQWLSDREPVAVLELDGQARAYPLQILTWHEIVNDELAGRPVVVTYCPLCNTAIAFDPTVDGRVLRFGTSGLLRNSDLVMWDRETESLWQQATGEAIVGTLAGTKLEFLPLTLVSWRDFRENFPDGQVLSNDTGFARAYGSNPYVFYDSGTPFLFEGEIDERFPAAERVVGIVLDGSAKAYPFSVISEERVVNDEVGGEPIVVLWGSADTASALSNEQIAEGRAVGVGVAYFRTVNGEAIQFEARGDQIHDVNTGSTWDIFGEAVEGPLSGTRLEPVIHANHLWFAWAAFNPEADIYEGDDANQ